MSSTTRLTRISWGLLMNSFCEHHKGSIRWQYRAAESQRNRYCPTLSHHVLASDRNGLRRRWNQSAQKVRMRGG